MTRTSKHVAGLLAHIPESLRAAHPDSMGWGVVMLGLMYARERARVGMLECALRANHAALKGHQADYDVLTHEIDAWARTEGTTPSPKEEIADGKSADAGTGGCD